MCQKLPTLNKVQPVSQRPQQAQDTVGLLTL
jgi:hypothetical protein